MGEKKRREKKRRRKKRENEGNGQAMLVYRCSVFGLCLFMIREVFLK